ncbi:symmetrical bis(5'-nucleosyl)-tetraphosphatase [Candidatus Legionella polyplacis]|uniref:bis(5'-nucleosyl)-tetraphosphatase (symmetrical) n=1 Tax=Candidatus Legionella polyplacis TaxID=2005262 RepID=A0ABZ2H055_9GAMM
MSDYAIGDIHGCYDSLLNLLEIIDFSDKRDKLWFVGDLVNRGPNSIKVLRFIKNLPIKPNISLGNHDLYLLNCIFNKHFSKHINKKTKTILQAHDILHLGHWLKQQSIIHYSKKLNVIMCHAGIPPIWDSKLAKFYANQLKIYINTGLYFSITNQLYEKKISYQQYKHIHNKYIKLSNYFTKMRYCNINGNLLLEYKNINLKQNNYFPWFEVPTRKNIHEDIIFGHWSKLNGICKQPKIYPLDTGCVWGKKLTALRLQDKKYFQAPGLRHTF